MRGSVADRRVTRQVETSSSGTRITAATIAARRSTRHRLPDECHPEERSPRTFRIPKPYGLPFFKAHYKPAGGEGGAGGRRAPLCSTLNWKVAEVAAEVCSEMEGISTDEVRIARRLMACRGFRESPPLFDRKSESLGGNSGSSFWKHFSVRTPPEN